MKTILEMIKQKIAKRKEENKQKELEEKENMQIATNIMGEIVAIVSKIKIAKKNDLQELLKLKDKYEHLGCGARRYLDYAIIDKLEDLIIEAQNDIDDSNK